MLHFTILVSKVVLAILGIVYFIRLYIQIFILFHALQTDTAKRLEIVLCNAGSAP